jgi:hypothetical protein
VNPSPPVVEIPEAGDDHYETDPKNEPSQFGWVYVCICGGLVFVAVASVVTVKWYLRVRSRRATERTRLLA